MITMKKLMTLALLVVLSLTATAQLDLTLYNARYLQQASFANAAFTPECKVNIGGLVYGSTFVRYGNNGLTRQSITRFTEGTDGAVEALNRMKPLNYLDLEARRDLIHFGFRVKQKNYFSLNASIRSWTTVMYPRDLATFLFIGNGVSPNDPGAANIPNEYQLLGKRANFDGFGVNSTTYAEIGLQYARKFLPDNNLSIGVRPKLLLGLANINTAESTFGLTTDANTFAWTLDGSYQFSTSLPFDTAGNLTIEPFSNLGFGVDLGASYNFNEKLNFSASVNDLGFITWKTNPNTYTAENGNFVYQGAPLDGSILGLGSSFDSLGSGLGQELQAELNEQFGADTNTDNYRTWLGARYNVGVNYQFADRHNVGALVNAHQVRGKLRAAFNVSYNFRVRKWFGFHANYSVFNNSFANVGLGMSFNIFPWQFYIMTDNALAFLPNATNLNLRTGINWTFGCQDDRDKDGIKDREDDCPDTPGEAKFNGCPDTDKDGIMDKEDLCPETPGSKEFNGCPDRDGDGIIDKDDKCPDAPGVAAFEGCPDTDNDGIQDSEDKCPTVAGVIKFDGCPDVDGDGIQDSEDDCVDVPGIPEFNGCPDTDGDGLMDSEDECPEVAGPIESKGCPDTDGDGLTDNKDGCPQVAGPIKNNGCPYGDRDGDGLIDKDDSCPDVFGPLENAGCPYSDLDGDGVFDKDDRCPQTPGVVENQGCPEIKKEEQEVLNTAFANLEFETGKDVIKSSSFESLNGLADLLIKKETWKLQISGHTDNVGSDAANMALSEKRAKAVGKYLESKGVAADRLIIKWYGETMPIADNDTPEGRTKNRRVEMEVMFD